MPQVLPSFTHLARMTDRGGLYEHADHDRPRPEHGYCVDDVARGLLVTALQPAPSRQVLALREAYLRFVLQAQGPDGAWRNRRGVDLAWRDAPCVDDCWGRALWGLGAVVGAGPRAHVAVHDRQRALRAFGRGAARRSPHARATAFAALGAAHVLDGEPEHAGARSLLADAVAVVDPRPGAVPLPRATAPWPWPEPRLRYANAVVPEVLMRAGHHLDRPELVGRGLDLLRWLLAVQTRRGHLSVVPVAGLGPEDLDSPGPRFDQQPIEVAALADACHVAFRLTGDAHWSDAVLLAVAWFHGRNDAGAAMLDEGTGAGFDGLTPTGRNLNQGAESTLALLATLQLGVRLDQQPETVP
jgi:hypothetical protein